MSRGTTAALAVVAGASRWATGIAANLVRRTTCSVQAFSSTALAVAACGERSAAIGPAYVLGAGTAEIVVVAPAGGTALSTATLRTVLATGIATSEGAAAAAATAIGRALGDIGRTA